MFVRIINNSEFVIDVIKSEIIFKSIKIKTDFLKSISKDRKNSNNFITLDIETRVVYNNDIGQHVPYCVCYYDGLKNYSFYKRFKYLVNNRQIFKRKRRVTANKFKFKKKFFKSERRVWFRKKKSKEKKR